jgi:hypothetical protein
MQSTADLASLYANHWFFPGRIINRLTEEFRTDNALLEHLGSSLQSVLNDVRQKLLATGGTAKM